MKSQGRWPPFTTIVPVGPVRLQRTRRSILSKGDLVANSGRFGRTLPLLLRECSAFAGFMAFADWLYARTGQTHLIALDRLFDLAHRYLVETLALDTAAVPVAA